MVQNGLTQIFSQIEQSFMTFLYNPYPNPNPSANPRHNIACKMYLIVLLHVFFMVFFFSNKLSNKSCLQSIFIAYNMVLYIHVH